MDTPLWRVSFILLVLTGSVVPATAGEHYPVYERPDRYQSVLTFIYDYDLKTAEDIVDSLIARAPNNPKPYFFRALVRWWYYVGETSSDSFKVAFIEAAENAIKVGENIVDENEEDREAQFFLAASCGYLARYYLLTGSWLNAYRYGKKSKAIFEKLVEGNQSLYDADFAIGAYNYYADKIPTFLKLFAVVIGVGGNKSLGLAQLHLAADSGSYSRVEALSVLGYINLQMENRCDRAAHIFLKLSAKYRSNPVFRALLANSYIRCKRFVDAISVCEETIRDDSVRYASINQLAGVHAELAYSWMLSGRYQRAIRQYVICDSLAEGGYLKESPWIFYNMGICEESEHNYPAAEMYYRRVLDCQDYFDYHSLASESINRVRKKAGADR